MADWPKSKRITELRSELAILEKSPSYREWELLNNAYVAYIQNADDLIAHVEIPQHDPFLAIKLMDADPTPEVKRSYQQELLRFLLNYCATASTLVDHSRNFIRRYEQIEPHLVKEYESRKDAVTGQKVAHFIQGLRNYMLHYQLPSISNSMSFTNQVNSRSFAIRLDCAALSKWKKWKPQARSYMENKDSVVLLDAVQDYTSAIQELYQWLFSLAQDTVQRTAVRRLDIQTEIFKLTHDT